MPKGINRIIVGRRQEAGHNSSGPNIDRIRFGCNRDLKLPDPRYDQEWRQLSGQLQKSFAQVRRVDGHLQEQL
jgi:hypothetical protein